MHVIRNRISVVTCCIALFLFFIPFVWMSPNQVELGGDSNRLYLYDPVAYTKINALYAIEPEGIGKTRADQSILPFSLMLSALYSLTHSPYVLISILNGMKLSVSFVSIYFIVLELLSFSYRKERSMSYHAAGVVAGLWYALSPSVGENLQTALLTHNQVFLNPLMFYVLLRFFSSSRMMYLWWAICISLVFSPNFSLTAPPPLFSFYPLALTFLFFYAHTVLRVSIPWKKLVVAALLFIGVHAFHLIPELVNIFDPGSLINLRLFDTVTVKSEAVRYFEGILWYGKVVVNIFMTHKGQIGRFVVGAVPFTILIGMLAQKKGKHLILLVFSFFLLTLFLMSANITHAGVSLYRLLIALPAFSMFRNFYGQFQWVHMFFYALFFGVSSYQIFRRLRNKYLVFCCIVLSGVCLYTGWPYISGSVFHRPLLFSNNTSSVMEMDPNFKNALSHIASLPDDGNIINFPFTDFSYQVVPGIHEGVYVGPSIISYLTDKRNFSGYQNTLPFSEQLLSLVKQRDYQGLKQLFALLHIQYVLFNASPGAYVERFPILPFTHISQSIPDVASLKEFVEQLVSHKVFEYGTYTLYALDDRIQEHIYIPQYLFVFKEGEKDDEVFALKDTEFARVGYIRKEECRTVLSHATCEKDIDMSDKSPSIRYEKINPTKYRVKVSHTEKPFFLVFSDHFHSKWQMYDVSDDNDQDKNYGSIRANTIETLWKKPVFTNTHIVVNGYANAWYIDPKKISGTKEHVYIIEMTGQRVIYISFVLSVVSICVFLWYGAVGLRHERI